VDPQEEVDRPRALLVIATLMLVTASWVSFLAPIAVRNYGDTFTALGANLPGSMSTLLAMPRVWLIFVVLALPLFIWIMARSRVTRRELGRMKLGLGAMVVLMALAYGLAAWSINLSLSRLGQIV
jgi:hypothetical protein